MNSGGDFPNIKIHNFSKYFSNLTANTRNNVPKKMSYVNSQNPAVFLGSKKLNEITAAPNQPAERLMDSPDKALSQGLVNNFVI